MKENLTFEQANAELEKIVKTMESGKLTLQESMKYYEQAFELLGYCYKQLDECRGQITDINTRINSLMKKD